MILITAIASIFSISHLFDLHEKLTEQSQAFHNICLQSLPTTVEKLGSLEALVCGKNMHDPELKELLSQSSLIHIFIVSGSHFLFLYKILARVPILRRFPLFPLSLYALATLCQAPALRALVFLALVELARRKKFFTPSVLLVLLSGVFCLCLFPQWLASRSLLMSLLAALVMALMSDYFGKNRETLPALFATQGLLYVVMGFCLWGFSSLHPLGILFNLTLGPLIGGLLFPLALAVVFIPPLGFLFDGMMTGLHWILKKSSPLLGALGNTRPLTVENLWIFYLLASVAAYFFLIWTQRRKASRD